MATNDEIEEKHRDYVMEIYSPELDKMLNEARAEGYKEGRKHTLKKLEHSFDSMYKDATSGELGGIIDQDGLARALGLVKSELKKLNKVD